MTLYCSVIFYDIHVLVVQTSKVGLEHSSTFYIQYRLLELAPNLWNFLLYTKNVLWCKAKTRSSDLYPRSGVACRML